MSSLVGTAPQVITRVFPLNPNFSLSYLVAMVGGNSTRGPELVDSIPDESFGHTITATFFCLAETMIHEEVLAEYQRLGLKPIHARPFLNIIAGGQTPFQGTHVLHTLWNLGQEPCFVQFLRGRSQDYLMFARHDGVPWPKDDWFVGVPL